LAKFSAIVYDNDSASWECYTEPVAVLVAHKSDEVIPLLARVEAASDEGFVSIGYVTYEAATAFDPSLDVHETVEPLARFGLFKACENINLSEIDSGALELTPLFSRGDYGRAFDRIKRYLADGDSYQVNFTYPLQGLTCADPLAIFSYLAKQQTTPYGTYLEWEDGAICSVTPELFFTRNDRTIRTEPMKGTRPRGQTAALDRSLYNELRLSAKDRAENLIIVDMIRNDLGRIAEPGSVKVDALFRIRELSTVWQLVSSVSALTDASLVELFKALFPCASVTGAPKTRTMEIIRELESQPRGVYTGAIGFVKPRRQVQFGVAIRTLTLDKRTHLARYGVGGGIVWDSDPDDEWQETIDKALILHHDDTEFKLLETMKYDAAHGIYLMDEHLERLARSAKYFGIDCDYPAIERLVREYNSTGDRFLRLSIDQSGKPVLDALEMPVSQPLVRLKLAVEPIQKNNRFLYHKTNRRDVYESAWSEVNDCDDVLLWNEDGEITETTIYNVFLEIEGQLFTPSITSGLLAGTFRRSMIEKSEVSEAVLSEADLARATRIFVANSVRGLIPAIVISA
jgi:para-aminobenzoate synthetase/4-amino-4-deoxychorismate lyase